LRTRETAAFVKEKIAEGRSKVSEILSKVHSGTYENVSGMSDGEKLEDDISSAMKEVEKKISRGGDWLSGQVEPHRADGRLGLQGRRG
jgi:hypothetical protein